MICLACGGDNDYGSAACKECARTFAVFPPFSKSNHVCQLQAAIREYLEGSIEFDGLGEVYARFTELSMNFQDRWNLLEGVPLLDRLPPELRIAFGAGVAELDRALTTLEEALGLTDHALETGETALLQSADELLTDFFKIGCGGCALLIDDLERVGEPETYGSFLGQG